jgi:Fe-Mn family superoxide dismutase
MTFILPKLNFSVERMTDVMSAETILYHHGKHHQTYIKNLNSLIINTPFEKLSIDEIIFKSSGSIFNNAAQTWNHTFYWLSLTDNPTAINKYQSLQKEVISQFGSVNNFKEKFIESAKNVFGSGWTWLVRGPANQLSFVNSSNADKPTTETIVPLMVCDIWEHAYYIDFRNERANYVQAFWDHIDWNFVNKNFETKSMLKIDSYITENK